MGVQYIGSDGLGRAWQGQSVKAFKPKPFSAEEMRKNLHILRIASTPDSGVAWSVRLGKRLYPMPEATRTELVMGWSRVEKDASSIVLRRRIAVLARSRMMWKNVTLFAGELPVWRRIFAGDATGWDDLWNMKTRGIARRLK